MTMKKPYKILRQGIYNKELINQKTKLNVYNNNNGKIIIGKHLAIELGVVVGDKIN